MRHSRAAAAAVAIVLLGAGALGVGGRPARAPEAALPAGWRPVDLPTSDWDPETAQGAMTALISGALSLDADGCVRLGGKVVVWPRGYAAGVDEAGVVTVVDQDGVTVARGGDDVSGGAGSTSAYTVETGRACLEGGRDPVFLQHGIRRAEPGRPRAADQRPASGRPEPVSGS